MQNKPRKSNENNFIALLNFIVDPAVIVDEKGKFRVVNDAFIDLTGLSKKELIGTAFLDVRLLTAKSKAILLKNLMKRMQGLPVEPYEINFTGKTGKARFAEVKAKKIDYAGHSADLVIFRDITRRKANARRLKEYSEKMEALVNEKVKEVKESEGRYRELTESISDIFFAMDKNLRYTYWNKASEKLTGISAKDAIGKSLTEIFPDIKGTKVEQFYKKVLRTKQSQSFLNKYRVRDKDFVFEISAYPTMDGLSVFVKGITEHKKAEEALKESEEKYRNLFENARDVIITFDLKGNLTSINKAVEEYGFKKDKMIGKNLLKFVSKKYWPKLLKELASLIQGKLVEGEIEMITPKGKMLAEYRSNPIRRGKKVVGFQTILRDITERKAMEEKLKQYSGHLEELIQKRTKELLESEKRYSVLVEEANVGVATLQDGKIVFANKKGEEIVGYSKEELFGLPFMKLVSEEYRQIVMERYAQRIKGESVPATYEIEVNAKNGEHIPVEISAAHISYQGHPADLIIVRDIREKKRMEEQRSKLERLASIGELAAMVGHDLRNPLTGIMGAAYYLKAKHGTEVGAKGKEMLEIIENAINYSNKIINDLLEYSQDLKLKLTATTPKAMVQSALSLLEVPEKIQIIDAAKDKPTVKADTEKIRKGFVNIIQNAIDAMPEGGTLTIKSRKVKGTLEIAFKDTGTGMSEETLRKLKGGVPLFTTKSKGMGFGLPICRRLVEAHGGKISVESMAGKGTTVTVTIPVNPEPVDEGEEKWIFSESMLSAITAAHRAR